MKQLTRLQSVIFLLGGALMVAGAGCFTVMWQQRVACWGYLLGALMFTTMQVMQSYEGRDVTIARLKRIQGLASILFILAGILMTDHVYGFFRPLFSNVWDYTAYVFNKWVILLLVAAVLEVYTVHRIDHELSKKNIKE